MMTCAMCFSENVGIGCGPAVKKWDLIAGTIPNDEMVVRLLLGKQINDYAY